MASDDKKAKTSPAPKSEAVATKKDASQPASKSPPAADAPKAAAAEKTADVSAGYSRGEGQKPVSQAYKDNWNAIYGKKKKKR
ncbi:MAG: hypothetical protein HYX37_10080 [Rhizobiales bacterium]|nr:hypothetical protein [Hyphomicrobiales bacterium]